jgi:hypothetical protein
MLPICDALLELVCGYVRVNALDDLSVSGPPSAMQCKVLAEILVKALPLKHL